MLQPPPLVHPPRYVLLPQARQVRRVVHPYLDPLAELFDERDEKRGARRLGGLARAAEAVGEDADL